MNLMSFNTLMFLRSCNHKYIGFWYLILGVFSGFFGFVLSLIMRVELSSSSAILIDPTNLNFYNLTITTVSYKHLTLPTNTVV